MHWNTAIFQKNLTNTTLIALFIVAFLYFPFVYFTNAGNDGSAPFYFVMIVVYFAFYTRGKNFVAIIFILIVFYISIMTFGHFNSSLIIPYPDSDCRFIDLCVAILLVSSVMAAVAHTAFTGYKDERRVAYNLMTELEKRNRELEFFKTVNDHYGHLYGDDVLRKIAREVEQNIRSYDILARYGGEEFVVLVTHSTEEDGYKIAERIRKSVEEIKYRHDKPVTISIGVSVNKKKDSVESIIQRADENLYEAKRTGRNKVVM